MFNKLFNISNQSEPVLVETPIQIRKSKPKAATTPSLKQDAEKVLERLLNDLQNVNNPKVDTLRLLALSLEKGGDLTSVLAFCKAPVTVVKKTKKKLISGKFY